MNDEQIIEEAKNYSTFIGSHGKSSFGELYDAFIAGAHSRDEEIYDLKRDIEDLQEMVKMRSTAFACARNEIERLSDPWISVEDRLPEEPFSVGSNRSKEVYVRTAKGCNYIGSYNFNRKDWIIVKDGYVELTNDNVIKWMPIPD